MIEVQDRQVNELFSSWQCICAEWYDEWNQNYEKHPIAKKYSSLYYYEDKNMVNFDAKGFISYMIISGLDGLSPHSLDIA